jgi:hypothetical protein
MPIDERSFRVGQCFYSGDFQPTAIEILRVNGAQSCAVFYDEGLHGRFFSCLRGIRSTPPDPIRTLPHADITSF